MSHCSSAREQCGLSGCVFPLSHSQRVAVAYTSRRGKPFRCYVPSYAREQLVIQVQRNLVAQASQGSPKQAEVSLTARGSWLPRSPVIRHYLQLLKPSHFVHCKQLPAVSIPT